MGGALVSLQGHESALQLHVLPPKRKQRGSVYSLSEFLVEQRAPVDREGKALAGQHQPLQAGRRCAVACIADPDQDVAGQGVYVDTGGVNEHGGSSFFRGDWCGALGLPDRCRRLRN